jgi:hypothetical protein
MYRLGVVGMMEEIKKVQVMMSNPNSAEKWHVAKEQVAEFAAETNRSMSNAILYLINIGLQAEAENKRLLAEAKNARINKE